MQFAWQRWPSYAMVLLVFGILFAGSNRLFAEESTTDARSNANAPTIIGGEEAEAGEWPWMAAIVYATSSDVAQGQFCGGSLIAPNWVLSAAHCTYDLTGQPRQPTDIDVVIGRHQLSSTDGERVRVVEIVRHPDYQSATFDNDVALFRLEHAVTEMPILLPRLQQSQLAFDGTLATVIGWGVTDEGRSADVLREVEVPVVDLKTCRRSYGIFNDKVTTNMLCAGFEHGGKDSCQGDSGGPLMRFDEVAQQWQQIGIVSWGEGCAEPNYYGVYTRVSNYTIWIRERIPEIYISTPAPTATPSPTPSATVVPTATFTPTPTPTATSTPLFAPTPTSTLIMTALPTVLPLPTFTVTQVPVSTVAATKTVTPPTQVSAHHLYLPIVTMNQLYPLLNGDFEAGQGSGWSEYSLQSQSLLIHSDVATVAAHSGTALAKLGGARSEVALVEQRVTISADAPLLQFWIQIQSGDDCGYDFGGVVVNDTVVNQFDLCRSGVTPEWQRRQVDLSDYIGKTVTLEIRAETDGFLDSVLYVDDVALVAVASY